MIDEQLNGSTASVSVQSASVGYPLVFWQWLLVDGCRLAPSWAYSYWVAQARQHDTSDWSVRNADGKDRVHKHQARLADSNTYYAVAVQTLITTVVGQS